MHFSGEWLLRYRVNLHSRIASRVLWRVAKADYYSEQDIYDTAFALPWGDWFDVSRTIRVNMAAIKCPLKSLDFITLRIKDAACDRFRAECGRRPSVDTRAADVRIAGESARVVHGPEADPAVWRLRHGFLDAAGFLFLRYARA